MTSEKRTAIVTGASRGIGLQIARTLGERAWRVVIVARDPERLTAASTELTGLGVENAAVAVDLTDPEAARRVVRATAESFAPPDLVVNNAGAAETAKAEDTTDAMLEATFALHVLAPMRLIREVLPEMKRRDSGCIVQMASTAGLRGFPFTTAYTAAKHGMVGLTRALRAELSRRRVGVYAVCPGFVDTDITRSSAAAIAARGKTSAEDALAAMAAQNRIGRMHTAAEVAAAVLDLVTTRTSGCVLELDRDPPAFVD